MAGKIADHKSPDLAKSGTLRRIVIATITDRIEACGNSKIKNSPGNL